MSGTVSSHQKSIFEFKSYKTYLHDKVGPRTTRKGIKGAMAKALKCQATYVSQVLYGNAHFSLEQAEILSEYFNHTFEERHYFLLLVQKDRAGTKRLEEYFLEQIEKILAQRLILTERLGAKKTLSDEHQSVYYSSWIYATIHMALTIPELQTPKALSDMFRIPMRRVMSVLDFLIQTGLAIKKEERFETGTTQIRIGNTSHHIMKHHTNIRNQAIDSLEREDLTDLHYSAVFTLSKEDLIKIKDKTLEFIKQTLDQVQKSKEEKVYGFCIDLFDFKK